MNQTIRKTEQEKNMILQQKTPQFPLEPKLERAGSPSRYALKVGEIERAGW